VRAHLEAKEYAQYQHRPTYLSDIQRRGDGDNGAAFPRCITDSYRPTIHEGSCLQYDWRGSAQETAASTIASPVFGFLVRIENIRCRRELGQVHVFDVADCFCEIPNSLISGQES
jgi:hypothetical protein